MKVTPLQALRDNYIWIIESSENGGVICVDPGESSVVLEYCQQNHRKLEGILVTHHHYDHTDGIKKILKKLPCPVYGSHLSSVKQISKPLKNGQMISLLDDSVQFTAIEIPGHTKDHMAFYGQGTLFSGDTLFSAGCGRNFECEHQVLYESLNKLCELPDATKLYCGHEYTENNLSFALTIEPESKDIQHYLSKVKELRDNNLPSLPSTLSSEKKINPFLRCEEPSVIQQVNKLCQKNTSSPVEVFAALRTLKDHF